ncbi:MAG: hypothetical protein LAO08_15625 [Acidobacteriia bacterium]|nr:hypothetical protein [Terriglobia bacterium]
MSVLIYTVPPAIAILAILWLLLRPRSSSSEKIRGRLADLHAGNAVPMHFQFFPQIRQALSEADDRYLEEAAPPRVARQARRVRRGVARDFLRGLREDYSNLEQLGRMIAALSPEISRRQEAERLALSLKFQMVCALVWLRLMTGSLPVSQIQYLTGLVGRLATSMDQAMSEINALSAGQLSGNVSA